MTAIDEHGAQAKDTCIRKRISLQYISSHWLFNRLQILGGLTLMDTRDRHRYQEEHIWAFGNIPTPTNDVYEKIRQWNNQQYVGRSCGNEIATKRNPQQLDLDAIFESMGLDEKTVQKLKKRKLTDIVLCGHHSQKNGKQEGKANSIKWILELATLFIQEQLVTSVKLLQEGYEEFASKYPFLILTKGDTENLQTPVGDCKNGMPSVEAPYVVTYPNEIEQGFLYLGNIWQASQAEIIHKLGITHVLSACMEPKVILPGIEYLNIPLKDKSTSPLCDYFKGAYEFIMKAKMSGGKVLVHCVQGISRSATLIVLYIMYAQKISLISAYNYVLERRNLIYPNLGFMKMLVEAEIKKYGTSSIKLVAEVDLLQNGLLPNRSLPYCRINLFSKSSSRIQKKVDKIFPVP